MDGNEISLLGLGIQPPWQLVDQRLDTDKAPHELRLKMKAERGSKYAFPACGEANPRYLEPVTKAPETLVRSAERVIRRWTSTQSNARLEGLNSLFQAATARARGETNDETFSAMIHVIAYSAGSVLKIHLKRRSAARLFLARDPRGGTQIDRAGFLFVSTRAPCDAWCCSARTDSVGSVFRFDKVGAMAVVSPGRFNNSLLAYS